MKQRLAKLDPSVIEEEFPLALELPGWYFRIAEVSMGSYLGEGTDLWGRRVSVAGSNPEELLKRCVALATAIETEVNEPQPRKLDQGRVALARDLEAVLKGELSMQVVLSQYERYRDAMPPCANGLQHFLADEDIRAKDFQYRAMQEHSLRKLIGLLRCGAPETELLGVSFLGSSEAQDAKK